VAPLNPNRSGGSDVDYPAAETFMSNYRNHRERRRRGFDDDEGTQEPSYFQREPVRPALQSSSPPVDGEVLWFNAEKGFGFVRLADGSDAFLHIRALESAGHRAVSEGMRLTVRLGEGPKGPQVADVLAVGPAPVTAGLSAPATRDPASRRSSEEAAGTVKWYNAEKGFGFIALDGGAKDAFVHVSALKRSGLELLEEGQRVVAEVVQGPKGPEVRALRLA